MDPKGLGLREQLLIAALECSNGNLKKTFTAEELLIHAWNRDRPAWGLRGFEEQYPDSAKIYKELDAHAGKEGIVGQGLLDKVHRRVYRLTPAGIAAASTVQPMDGGVREKASRELAQAIRAILHHPVFQDWLKDPSRPKYFREAGHFWGIAPGTPPKAVRERVGFVEQTLKAALETLDRRGVEEIVEHRGKVLFDRNDIERCLEFQVTLRKRFARDLQVLDPEIDRVPA